MYRVSMTPTEIEDVLSFWFGELDATGLASKAPAMRWFKKDPAFDDEVGARSVRSTPASRQGRSARPHRKPARRSRT